MRPARSCNRGFTLIEATVVVAVIAVIAAMAIPRVGGALFEGREAGKQGDLRQMTIAIARHFEQFRAFPSLGVGLPPVPVRDVDLDGVVRVAVDTARPDGEGSLPNNIDAVCVTNSTDLQDALARCFVAIDVQKASAFLAGKPAHVGEDVTQGGEAVPRFDGKQGTPDWTGGSLNLNGDAMAIYVVDDGGPNGTSFPKGVLTVWNMTEDGKPWALKDDRFYGK